MKFLALINNEGVNGTYILATRFKASIENLRYECDIKTTASVTCDLHSKVKDYNGVIFFTKDYQLSERIRMLGICVLNPFTDSRFCDNKVDTYI